MNDRTHGVYDIFPYTMWPWTSTIVAHLEGGGGWWCYVDMVGDPSAPPIYTPEFPAGANQLFNHGGARWAEFGEMEPVHSFGRWSGKGGVWWVYR